MTAAGATDANPGRHPIGVVSERTGLTPDVLRVWERRYGAVSPERTGSGQRLYSDGDVERLRLLQRATAAGRAIGQVAALGDAELRSLVGGDVTAAEAAPAAPADTEAWIGLALERAAQLDAVGLEQILRRLALLWGTPVFLERFGAPLFRRIGEEWHEGRLKVAHEHLASSVMRGVLLSLSGAVAPLTGGGRILVGTPAGERHEIGALLVAAAAAGAGWRVTYVGTDLPADELAAAAEQAGARAVALSVVLPEDEAVVAAELLTLRGRLPAGVAILVGGGGSTGLRQRLEGAGIRFPGGLDELRSWLLREI
jgi:MerR family transcriptional regulator, light-induced transcriptional regulator